jgi:ribosomal protein L7/L12
VREATGIGLAEAKHLVESTDPSALGSMSHSPEGFDLELLELLRAGQKIEAIRRHREATHAGLRESKDYVEDLARRHGIQVKPAGCLGVIVLILAALGTASVVASFPLHMDTTSPGQSQ